jgi:hypothetical protein
MLRKITALIFISILSFKSYAQKIDVKHFCNTVTAFYEGNINQYKVGASQNSGKSKITRLILPPAITDAKVSMFLVEEGVGSAIRYMVSKDTSEYNKALIDLRKIIGENSENYPNPDKYSKGLIFLKEPSQERDLKVIDIAYYGYSNGTFFLPMDEKAAEYSLSIQLKKEMINNNWYVFIEVAKFFDKPTHNVLQLLYKNTSSLLFEEGKNIDWLKIEKESIEANQKKNKAIYQTYAEQLKSKSN